jgi:thioredoxin reductase (NADPH)
MTDAKQTVHQTLILGSGPAGYTAAIYAARANLEPVLLAGRQPGGQLTITTDVENYPGFPKGVLGPEMMEMFREQAERFGTKVHYSVGVEVDLKQRPFTVVTDDEQTFKSETLIVSTGASALYLGLPNEQKLQGRGVSACATCDGFFFKGKEVYVVGGGDSACEEANFLTKFASRVNMVVRRDALRASKIMQKRVLDNPKIQMLWGQNVTDVFDVQKGHVNGLELTATKDGKKKRVAADGLFLAIGHRPNTELFAGVLDMDEKGYIVTVPGKTATNVPGVFAAGDCQDSFYRQAVTAAGTGCMAAIEVERWLEAQHAK